MATHFHGLKIQEVRRETPSSVSIAFEVPSQLREEYSYTAGQYLTLRQTIAGEELRRSYSLCSSPEQDEYRIAVKEVKDGRFSTWVNRELLPSASIDVMPPMGNFMRVDERGHHMAFAAGSGITPVISILRSVLAANTEDRFTLFYGNKTWEEIMFREELAQLTEQYAGRLEVLHVLSQEQRPEFGFGRLDSTRLETAIRQGLSMDGVTAAYLCGPSEMIFGLRDELQAKGVAADKVHFELFTAPDTIAENVDAAPVATSSSGGQTATFVLDGESTVVEVIDPEQTLLDIGLAQGIDLPFACQGGVCCTCRAKVQRGAVDMRQNFSLGDSEVEEGYVLTCQSYPTGVDTVIDYDA